MKWIKYLFSLLFQKRKETYKTQPWEYGYYLRDGDYYVWTRGTKLNLSKNFSTTEFECCCGNCKVKQKINVRLIEKLEKTRARIRRGLHINEGFRCHDYQENLRKRGYPTSKGISTHELGDAADITPIAKHVTALRIAAQALRRILPTYFKAIGDGGHWFHVDLRDDKVRRWKY